jgi:hypothetical protein
MGTTWGPESVRERAELQPTDRIVPRQRLGWNVVVTGYAHPIIDLADIARLSAVLIPWVDVSMDAVVAIESQIVTDYRLTPNHRPPPARTLWWSAPAECGEGRLG